MQVAYKIIAEGSDITRLIADRLLSAEIVDQAGVKSDRLTLVLDDRDQVLELPRTGAKLEVWLGYIGQALVRMGAYVVDEVDVIGPAREMTIRANAADMTGGIKAPRERSWHQKTLGDIVRTIAGEHGLQPAIAAELASIQLGHVDQTDSDMQLLQRLCADQDATCKVADKRLVVAKRAAGKSTGGKDLPPVVLTPGQCESWTATLADRGKYKSVKAYWQDTSQAERKSVKAGSGTPELELRNSFATQDEARRAADSRLKSLSRGTAKVGISGLIGDPTIAAEMPATLVGFRAGIDGDGWIINSVTHSFTGSGYTCALEIENKD